MLKAVVACVLVFYAFNNTFASEETSHSQKQKTNSLTIFFENFNDKGAFNQAKEFNASEGWLNLKWDFDDKENSVPQKNAEYIFEVQRADDANFTQGLKAVYKGKDQASFISGMPAGLYFFRIKVSKIFRNSEGKSIEHYSNWSKSLPVRVEFVSQKMVKILMTSGLIVFVIIVFSILIGNMKFSKK